MKTSQMSSTLRAFAGLLSPDRSRDLQEFAAAFDGGTDETVVARVKRITKGLSAKSWRLRCPPTLKESLTGLAAGFSASKAKQASDFKAILSLLDADESASIDDLVVQISEAVKASQAGPSRPARQRAPNERLVVELADELTRTVLDAHAFSKVMARLHDASSVSTSTLSAVANRFLGNTKRYSGRKSAITDITNRQEQDARTHARTKGLEHIPV